ncbi:MAG: phage antirepressor KilAC domain-containing protein [Bacteroidota bacterium]|nr:phage antirepressor KilAC domain-containing protein [Bacteroidota bacterium]
MSNIQVFKNEQFGEVRAIDIDGIGWLVGKDVAERLGYKDTVNALKDHVDEEDKLIWQIATSGQKRNMTVINESGLYSLVLSSKLPSAKAFKKWVTSEVLPGIRKHGLYATANTIENMLSNPDFAILLLQKYKEEQQQKEALQNKVEKDKPKAVFADSVTASNTTILIGDLAKIMKQNGIDIGQKRLFEWLRNNGFLIKGGTSRNMPTHKAADMGIFFVKESSVTNPDGSIRITKTTKVTGKGQLYFVNKFQIGIDI